MSIGMPLQGAPEDRSSLARPPVSSSLCSKLKGKRVAMLCLSPYPADPRPRRAVEAFLREGMSVDFICIQDGKSPRRERSNGLDILRLAIEHRRGGKLAYAYEYSAFILATVAILALRSLKRRYDLVYVHNMPDILVASALIPKFLGAKVILDQHDPMPELTTTIFGLPRRCFAVRVMEWLEKWSMARAHLVITVNVACKRIFASRSCPAEKIGVVMNAPDEKIFGAELVSPRLRERATGPFVIMYHGSIVERNGLDLAVEALARLRDAVPAAELRIYGKPTPFLDKVLEAAQGKGISGSVQYRGPRQLEELVQEISDCDIGIVPNHQSEFAEINTPTRIFEYLALGKPVIVPKTMGIMDYFAPDSLLFFAPGAADDLAKQIQSAWASSSEALKITERGQAVFLQHRWVQERQTLLDLVGQLLNG